MNRRSFILAGVGFVSVVFACSLWHGEARGVGENPTPVTFNKDVAPILYQHCVTCHRPGEVAPMSLLTYKDARPWARSIREKVVTGQMPPWHADAKYGSFSNDRRMTPREIETISAWVDRGAEEGVPGDRPPAPNLVSGWNIGKPDAVYHMSEEYAVPASGVVEYKYFTTPGNFKEDRWVQAAEIRPGNPSVVHHIIVFTQKGTDRRLLAGYTPGEEPMVLPDGVARRIPAGSDLVFQIHYTPNGKAVKDRSYIGFRFSRVPSRRELLTRPVLNAMFTIPPGNPDYKVEASYTFTEDVHIYSLMPHMHWRGKDFMFRLTPPGGASQVILSVPNYDFSWQTNYQFREPVKVSKGTTVDCIAHFDNSDRNKNNPDPTKEVRWGDQTWEEMMVGWISYTADSSEVAAK